MTMTFSADASGTFGTIEINGVPQIEVHNDGSIKTPAGKLVASAQGIVGTVSQSGGLPTGAVVERGSNANGEYVKFADGTLICAQKLTALAVTPVVYATPIYDYVFPAWTFPAVFITNDELAVAGTGGDASAIGWLSSYAPSTTSVQIQYFTKTTSSVNITIRAVAIGRWF